MGTKRLLWHLGWTAEDTLPDIVAYSFSIGHSVVWPLPMLQNLTVVWYFYPIFRMQPGIQKPVCPTSFYSYCPDHTLGPELCTVYLKSLTWWPKLSLSIFTTIHLVGGGVQPTGIELSCHSTWCFYKPSAPETCGLMPSWDHWCFCFWNNQAEIKSFRKKGLLYRHL